MADILSFRCEEPVPVHYNLDVTLHPDNLIFTVSGIKTDHKSLLKIADELDRIASIIRADVVTGIA